MEIEEAIAGGPATTAEGLYVKARIRSWRTRIETIPRRLEDYPKDYTAARLELGLCRDLRAMLEAAT